MAGSLRRCLVVDLDDTLWAGSLAEDGVDGVRCGLDDPLGVEHWRLQGRIRMLRRNGVMLAICSANDPANVDHMFRAHPEMPLAPGDFALAQFGWTKKDLALQRIARRLDLRTEDLAFMDGNHAELELVRHHLPEVLCLSVPGGGPATDAHLEGLSGFERPSLVHAGELLPSVYHGGERRRSPRHCASDLSCHLRWLDTRVHIWPATSDDIPVARTLFARTSQFTLTSREYSSVQLQRFLWGPSHRLWLFDARDRFRDLGTIGACLLSHAHEDAPFIESFVVSCRALGRQIECAVLEFVAGWCFGARDRSQLEAESVPTAHNLPTRRFYERQGFRVMERRDNGSVRYSLAAVDFNPCGEHFLELTARADDRPAFAQPRRFFRVNEHAVVCGFQTPVR